MAGAISGTTIAAIVAMVAGAAMRYKASVDASKRATEETQKESCEPLPHLRRSETASSI